jgi:hypothetical protein
MKKIISIVSLFLIISLGCVGQQKTQSQKTDSIPQGANYYLIGSVQAFQLLIKVLTTPGDVTPNQIKAVAEWVVTAQQLKVDSTGLPPKKQ